MPNAVQGWHTGGFKNREAVWKREQEAEEERRKVDQLKKQILEERQVQELRAVEGKGRGVGGERVEFLYSGPLAGKVDDQKQLEREYLLGKPVDSLDRLPTAAAAPPPRGDIREDEPAVLKAPREAAAVLDSANERWARMHSDPLLAMKQQELAAMQRARGNPMLMARLKDEVEAKRARKEARREARKEDKERRREAKAARRAARRADEEAEPAPREVAAATDADRRRDDAAGRKRGRDDDLEMDARRHPAERASDGARAQGPGVRYGLTPNANAPDRRAPSSGAGAPSSSSAVPYQSSMRSRRDTARERPQAPPRRPVQLTEEERRRRREEMQRDASSHDGERVRRIAAADMQEREAERRDEGKQATDRHHSERPSFIADTEKSIYGNDSNASLEERVGRRKFFADKRSAGI